MTGPRSSPVDADDVRPDADTLSLDVPDGIVLDARVHLPRSSPRAVAVLVHGINTNFDEGGMYVRLGDRLAADGVAALRFSFRGHGRSTGSPRGVTLAGEMLDLETAVTYLRSRWADLPLVIVASSVGAVAALETAYFTRPDLLVLWNPVLDLRRTFIEPELSWGRQNFHPEAWAAARRNGFLLLDGEFEMGRVLLDELARYRPLDALSSTAVPSLTVHGDQDSYVSYDIARQAAADRGGSFHTVPGSDHGFDTREREDQAIAVTANWIRGRLGADRLD